MYDVTVKYTTEYLQGLPEEGLELLAQEARKMKLGLEMVKAGAGGYTERPHVFKKVRRDIARFKTEIRRR